MKTRLIAILLLAALVLSVLAACGGKTSILTPEEAQKVALKDAGLSQREVDDVHTHIVEYRKTSCYNIHITVGDTEYEYLIDPATGEILDSDITG